MKLSEELGSKEWIAAQFGNMGIVYQIKGDFDEALEYCEKALLISRNLGNRIQEARVLIVIGDIFKKREDIECAIDYYLQAQELAAQV